MLKLACVIAALFIIGMLFIQASKEERPDLSSHYFPDMTIEERQHFSAYNWKELDQFHLQLESDESGMASIRAVNGEIILQVFLERGIREDIQIEVPNELDRILIEYKNTVEDVNLGAKMIALEIWGGGLNEPISFVTINLEYCYAFPAVTGDAILASPPNDKVMGRQGRLLGDPSSQSIRLLNEGFCMGIPIQKNLDCSLPNCSRLIVSVGLSALKFK